MILILACLGALALAYLVVSPKVQFPLLFDAGLCVIALTMILGAEKVETTGALPVGVGLALSLGFGLLLASAYRQKRKRTKEAQRGEPTEISGQVMSKIHGGKHADR